MFCIPHLRKRLFKKMILDKLQLSVHSVAKQMNKNCTHTHTDTNFIQLRKEFLPILSALVHRVLRECFANPSRVPRDVCKFAWHPVLAEVFVLCLTSEQSEFQMASPLLSLNCHALRNDSVRH